LGGDGEDYINGDERLYEEEWCANPSGNDRLYGNAGDDYLRADLGRDLLKGGPGRDEIYTDAIIVKVLDGPDGSPTCYSYTTGDDLPDRAYGEGGYDEIWTDDGVYAYVDCGPPSTTRKDEYGRIVRADKVWYDEGLDDIVNCEVATPRRAG
jgi:hypothetical protein